MSDLIEVGSVRKTHGFRGELKLSIEEAYKDDFARAGFYFIGHDKRDAIPYEMVNMRGEDWICQLEGLTTKEAAAALRGQRIFLKSADVSEDITNTSLGSEDAYRRFVGFAIIDTEEGEIGAIDAVDEDAFQTLARVRYRERDVLIPLNHDLIRGVDFTRKIVFVSLPGGLLEL